MPFRLCDTPLFRGIPESEIEPLLRRLGAVRRQYQKGETILPEGAPAGGIGLVLSGLAVIQSVDIWGNGSVLGSAGPGGVFADAYACLPGEPLAVTVQAARPAQVLLVPLGPVLSGAPGACPHQVTLLRNLLAVCAGKSLQLSRRMTHTAPKTIRGRLLSYLSECARRSGGPSFSIPYDRQQLADYLNVDRSALSGELSRMRRDRLIRCRKNQFTLLVPADG